MASADAVYGSAEHLRERREAGSLSVAELVRLADEAVASYDAAATTAE
ncbi:hypothetical protein [Streptomyces sp. NBC_00996]|nr:hypothetical protein OG390_39610 [Streptomyces sp. NBC_00996]